MKQLYLDIIEKLNEATELLSVEKGLFTGQVTDPESIDFPSILIDFPYCYFKDTNAKIQHGYILVKLMLCFDPATLTGINVTDALELKEIVYSSIQGLKRELPTSAPITSGYYPLTRGTERVETKYPGVYVFEMDFYTTIVDTGVYTKRNFVNASTYDSVAYPLPDPIFPATTGVRIMDTDIDVEIVDKIENEED